MIGKPIYLISPIHFVTLTIFSLRIQLLVTNWNIRIVLR